MKTILVDAINTFVDKEKGMFIQMYELLETYPNKKIVVSSAGDEQIKKFKLDELPYPLFTLKKDPPKQDPRYYETLLEQHNLAPENVVYFEHNEEAVEVAESLGITTYHYDKDVKNLGALKDFLDSSLS